MLKRVLFVAAVLIGAVVIWSQLANALVSHNPFGLPDVISPDGRDAMSCNSPNASRCRAARRSQRAAMVGSNDVGPRGLARRHVK